MIGCHIGRIFQVTVAGGSYQEGLTSVLQGVPPGLLLSEQGIYGDLLLRKPGADELSTPLHSHGLCGVAVDQPGHFVEDRPERMDGIADIIRLAREDLF
jgi:hypothetical protein